MRSSAIQKVPLSVQHNAKGSLLSIYLLILRYKPFNLRTAMLLLLFFSNIFPRRYSYRHKWDEHFAAEASNLCAVPLAARQAPETGCLPCKLSICFLLALIGAIQERHDLRTCAIRVGAECSAAGTLGDAVLHRPQNRVVSRICPREHR